MTDNNTPRWQIPLKKPNRHLMNLKYPALAILYIVICMSYIFYLYMQAKRAIDNDINDKLYYGALATSALLGDRYHDNLVDKNSKTQEEDWDSIQRLTDYSNSLDLTFLYTVIKRNGQAILVSSSASEEELAENSYVRFFDAYPDASQELLDTFETRKITWTNYTDHWGDFRAVFVPKQSQDGSLYVAGAEISLEKYHSQLRSEALRFAGFAIVIFAAFSIFVASYLIRMRLNLQQLVAKEKELENSKNAAEAANRAKSEFLTTMSHEVRTPLNGIIGATELMEFGEVDAKQREYIKMIRTCGNTLLTLINDILDLSRIEAGKLELNYNVVSLRPLIDSVLEMMQPSIKYESLKLLSQVSADVPSNVYVDVQRLRQVLINLVGNAIKFTDQGTVCLSVEVETRNEKETELRFTVRDTGVGISQENLQLLFKPFQQLDGSTTRRYGGTGLGLSISNRLIKLMGGQIFARSQPGKGSEFYFFLRIPNEHNELPAQPHSIDSKRHIPASLKILLAEDNLTNQTVTMAMLNKLGYSVRLVDNGNDVLQAMHQEDFDIILMDINMPGMDGVEATRLIRRMQLPRQPYIVAYTANAFTEERDVYLSSGINDCLTKPLQLNKLIETLDKAALAAPSKN